MQNYSNHKQVDGAAVMYPDIGIQDYLNMRRSTKDKCCLIIFFLYALAHLLTMGIGFFYGNYNSIGVFVNGKFIGDASSNRHICQQYVSEDYSTCLSSCAGTPYLGKICITSAIANYTATYSSQVQGLIVMYDLKYTLPMLTYITFSLLLATAIIFSLFCVCPKLIYVCIVSFFVMLLGFAFYLLENVERRTTDFTTTSLFYSNEQSIRFIAFLFLGIYLLIFPFVLFGSRKIQFAVLLISKLKQYFTTMARTLLFTIGLMVVSWAVLILQIFLVLNFYSAGSVSDESQESMFYTYTGVDLKNPACLVFHFVGLYWLMGTLVSWHKYFTGTSMCIWYFKQSQGVYPFRRGIKRSSYHIGSAALDAILMPLQWIHLLAYSLCVIEHKEEEEKEDKCITSCWSRLSQFISKQYSKINRSSPSCSVLTNSDYFSGCQMTAWVFAQKNHKFFNIGGILIIFLTLFVCVLWVFVAYLIIFTQVYSRDKLPVISSMFLPIFCVFLIALVLGSLLANLYAAAIDCLLFCYLMERKDVLENEELQRQEMEFRIKTDLDTYYYRTEPDQTDKILVYQEMEENTTELNYISRRE